jgi:hypothetical protein
MRGSGLGHQAKKVRGGATLMKRTLCVTILSVAVMLLMAFSVLAQADGFRGLKWGTEFSTVESQMEHVRTDPSYGGIKLYRRLGDEMKIGGAELQSIQYGFWQNKLSNVVILFEGYTNFTSVRDSALEKFGRGSQPNRYIERYFWFNDPDATITIDYSEGLRKGRMYMSSKQITAEQKRFNEKRAKSGAESGF